MSSSSLLLLWRIAYYGAPGHDAVGILPVSIAELHYYCHALLTSMADSHVGLEDYPRALSCLRRFLRLRGKMGDIEGEVGVLRDLAKVYENWETRTAPGPL